MKNFVQPGESLDFVVPSGGCTSGVGLLIGAMFLVAAVTAAEAETAAGSRVGVFDLAATAHASTQAMTAFVTPVYWDNTTKKVTITATGNQLIGIAIADKASAATTARILLLPKLFVAGATIADISLAVIDGTNVSTIKTDVDARMVTIAAKINAMLAAMEAGGVVVA